MKGALWICERDLRKFFRQPFVMVSVLLVPFLMLILLGYAFGGSITRIPVSVVQYSQGRYSSAFLGFVSAEDTVHLRDAPDLDTAQHLLQQGKVKAIIYIPSGFDGSLDNDNNAMVIVYLDNTDPLSASAISSSLTRAAQRLSSQIQLISIHGTSLTVNLTNFYRKFEYIEFMAPGSIVQAIFIVSNIAGGISILFDKQRGVIEGYLVTPLRRHEIVVGFLLAGVVKATFSSLAMLILAILVAGVRPMTDLTGFLLMLFTVFLTGLGLISMMTAFAVRAPAPEVYQFAATPINLILFFTSGAIYPVEGLPDWMRSITVVNPETYAVHALRALMYKGTSLPAVGGDFAFLAVFTIIMSIIATISFKREL